MSRSKPRKGSKKGSKKGLKKRSKKMQIGGTSLCTRNGKFGCQIPDCGCILAFGALSAAGPICDVCEHEIIKHCKVEQKNRKFFYNKNNNKQSQ